MPTVDEFRAALANGETADIVDRWILAPGAAHVSDREIEYLQFRLAETYRVASDDVQVLITGSAKLGFSLVTKSDAEGAKLPRYRPFSKMSDIDVAVISPSIFDLVWSELSAHSHRAANFPRRSERLGDYLVCGWLRPDHFPTGVRLPYCDLWWDAFRRFSRDPRFNRRRVRGGLFYSRSELQRYVSRAVLDCSSAEELA